MAFAISAFAMTSCEDVPAPYDIPTNGEDENASIYYTSVGLNNGWTTYSATTDNAWSQGASYTQATGYQDWESSGSKSNHEVKSYLISPAFKTTAPSGKVKISFDQTIRYTNNVSGWENNHKIYISKNYAGDYNAASWEELAYTPVASPYSDWTLYSSGDIQLPSDYVNTDNVYISFYFYAPASASTTWELKNFVIEEGEADVNPEIPDGPNAGNPEGTGTVDDPYNVAAAQQVAGVLASGATTPSAVFVRGIVSSIKEVSASYGNATFYISDDGTDSNTFYIYRALGLGNKNVTDENFIKVGDEVVICGKLTNYNGTLETAQKEAYVYSVNGVGGGDTPDTPDTPGDATEITCAKAVEICNALEDKAETAELYTVTGYITETDGKISRDQQVFWMADTKDGGKVFEAYWANIPDPTKALPVGTKLKMTGKLMRYGTTPEMKNGNVVVLEMGEGGSGNEGGNDNPSTGGATLADFTNGDFEQWDGSTPVNWKSACTASSATLAQSTDAHGGSYSVNVNGNSSSNKRLAYKELTLEAGTYEFSFYAKATSDNKAQVRPGYVPVTDGSVGNYAYGDYANLSTSWTKVTHEFTLAAKTTICLVVMNPKASNYSSGEDVLIDDASLVMKSSAKAKRIRK